MSACLLYFLYLTFIKHYLLITQWTFFVFSFLLSSSSFFQLLNSFIINIYPETINRINVNLISLFPLKKKKKITVANSKKTFFKKRTCKDRLSRAYLRLSIEAYIYSCLYMVWQPFKGA